MSTADRTVHLDDMTATLWADRELRQRRAWARELGLDPERVDLLALPPVPRRADERVMPITDTTSRCDCTSAAGSRGSCPGRPKGAAAEADGEGPKTCGAARAAA